MAITKISTSNNIGNAIDYDIGNNKAHPNHDGLKKRVLACWGVNASNDLKQFKKMTQHLLNINPKVHRNSIHCIRKIIAFKKKPKDKSKIKKDEHYFNYKSHHDRELAMKICRFATKKQFPKNASLIILQADSKNNILHAHICTMARNLVNGKSSTHNASWQRSYKYTDEALKHYHVKQDVKAKLQPGSNMIKTLLAHHKHSYIINLESQIIGAVQKSKNPLQFQKHMHNYGIKVRMFKSSKRNFDTTGNTELFNEPGKKTGNSIKVDGGYLRLRPHFTYEFNYKGKTKVIRHKRLGNMFDKPTLMDMFNRNAHGLQLSALFRLNDKKAHKKSKPSSTTQTTNQPKQTAKPKNNLKAVPHKLTMTAFKPTYETKNVDRLFCTPNNMHQINGTSKPTFTRVPHQFRSAHYHPKTNTARVALNDLLNQLKNIGSYSKQKQLAARGRLSKKIDDKTQESMVISYQNKMNYKKVQDDNRKARQNYNDQLSDYYKELKKEQEMYRGGMNLS